LTTAGTGGDDGGPVGGDGRHPVGRKVPWAVVMAIAGRPALWPAAVSAVVRIARPGWWRRRPFLPVPDEAYWRFRMGTAYGGAGTVRPAADDVVGYLRWYRRSR